MENEEQITPDVTKEEIMEPLVLNFSGNNQSAQLCIPAEDCVKLADVLNTFLQSKGINSYVVVPEIKTEL